MVDHMSQLWGRTDIDLAQYLALIISENCRFMRGLNAWPSDYESAALTTEPIRGALILDVYG